MVAAQVRIGRAMTAQLDRVNNDPDYLRQRVEELEELVATLRQQLRTLQRSPIVAAPVDDDGAVYLEGRPVGTQSEYARHWKIPAYTVCRWCVGALDKKGRRSPPKLQTVVRNGRTLVYLDQPPPFGKRGRKKSR